MFCRTLGITVFTPVVWSLGLRLSVLAVESYNNKTLKPYETSHSHFSQITHLSQHSRGSHPNPAAPVLWPWLLLGYIILNRALWLSLGSQSVRAWCFLTRSLCKACPTFHKCNIIDHFQIRFAKSILFKPITFIYYIYLIYIFSSMFNVWTILVPVC